MYCLILLSLYFRVLTATNPVWSIYRSSLSRRRREEGVSKTSNSSVQRENRDVEDGKKNRQQYVKSSKESNTSLSESLVYNDYFKEMYINIKKNLDTEVDLDTVIYQKYLTYKIEILNNEELKKHKGNYMYNEAMSLIPPYKYDKTGVAIDPSQRINIVKMVLKSLTSDVIIDAPEIIGMSMKLIASLDKLSNEGFLASLLQLDFCINIMKENPSGEVYKNCILDLPKSPIAIQEQKYLHIYKLIGELYQTLHNEKEENYNILEFCKYHIRILSEDVVRGLYFIYFLLPPKDAREMFMNLMKLARKESGYSDIVFDLSLLDQSSKIFAAFFSKVFGYEFEDKIQRNNTSNVLDYLKLIKASVYESLIN